MTDMKDYDSQTPERGAFVTGSRAYGVPTAQSDIDLVVYVSKKDYDRLALVGRVDVAEWNYIAAGGRSIRFGRLNLIVCTNGKMFDVWKKATTKLKKMAPVTRGFACKFMARMRKAAGFVVPEPEPSPSDKDIPF